MYHLGVPRREAHFPVLPARSPMSDSKIQLAVAAFLDSPQAEALSAVPRKNQATIIERFLRSAFEDLGKAPKLLDGHDLHELVGHVLPGRFPKKDPLAEHAMDVVAAYLDHLNEVEVVSNLWEMKTALEGTRAEFEESVRTGRIVHHGHAPQKPKVNAAPKVGRNDPCPCGSGKKFKKCCEALGS
ncbi:MAG: SEC-C domain-containing protein [Planctomycetes bacterium]|nr:SEC-C domain-containing protein [Planctomycetota bacterium]